MSSRSCHSFPQEGPCAPTFISRSQCLSDSVRGCQFLPAGKGAQPSLRPLRTKKKAARVLWHQAPPDSSGRLPIPWVVHQEKPHPYPRRAPHCSPSKEQVLQLLRGPGSPGAHRDGGASPGFSGEAGWRLREATHFPAVQSHPGCCSR